MAADPAWVWVSAVNWSCFLVIRVMSLCAPLRLERATEVWYTAYPYQAVSTATSATMPTTTERRTLRARRESTISAGSRSAAIGRSRRVRSETAGGSRTWE